MGDKEFLLTYKVRGAGFDFEWFDTEEELLERVKQLGDNIMAVDGLQIKVIKHIIGE